MWNISELKKLCCLIGKKKISKRQIWERLLLYSNVSLRRELWANGGWSWWFGTWRENSENCSSELQEFENKNSKSCLTPVAWFWNAEVLWQETLCRKYRLHHPAIVSPRGWATGAEGSCFFLVLFYFCLKAISFLIRIWKSWKLIRDGNHTGW